MWPNKLTGLKWLRSLADTLQCSNQSGHKSGKTKTWWWSSSLTKSQSKNASRCPEVLAGKVLATEVLAGKLLLAKVLMLVLAALLLEEMLETMVLWLGLLELAALVLAALVLAALVLALQVFLARVLAAPELAALVSVVLVWPAEMWAVLVHQAVRLLVLLETVVEMPEKGLVLLEMSAPAAAAREPERLAQYLGRALAACLEKAVA